MLITGRWASGAKLNAKRSDSTAQNTKAPIVIGNAAHGRAPTCAPDAETRRNNATANPIKAVPEIHENAREARVRGG